MRIRIHPGQEYGAESEKLGCRGSVGFATLNLKHWREKAGSKCRQMLEHDMVFILDGGSKRVAHF